jgi:hypothetical protein
LTVLLPDSSTLAPISQIVSVQLDDLEDEFEDQGGEEELLVDRAPPEPEAAITRSRQVFVPIPIPLVLDTPHDLPQAATFRLRSPASLLALTGGKRILTLDAEQTIWDRMPYSAAAAAIHARHPTEEETVEQMVGGEQPDRKPNGIQWAMRSK